jgi:hypothetical protein
MQRSPSAAPVMSSTAKLRLYAFTVHSNSAIEAPSSSRIVLSAVDTTSVSSATISDATDASASTQRECLRSVVMSMQTPSDPGTER